MKELLEFGMMICFGISWPMACVKAFKSRTAKGISISFVFLILTGYVFGITSKIISHNITYVLAAYLFNFAAVSFYAILYFRNRKIDKKT